MKRISGLIFLLSVLLIALCSCAAGDAKRAAGEFLDRCIACDGTAYAEVMGGEGSAVLTDIETFALSRMSYKIISAEAISETRIQVTVDIRGIDLMNALNTVFTVSEEAIENEKEFDPDMMLLEILNSGSAEYATFRAVLPMVSDGASWRLDSGNVKDDLRDALSGGSFGWWKLYAEYFAVS